jgi:Family of unknown function (DUF5808)
MTTVVGTLAKRLPRDICSTHHTGEKSVKRTGTFLRVPYDFRLPTWTIVKERMWNPGDPRIFTPRVCGWGWSINFYQLFRRAGPVRRQQNRPNETR